MGCSIPGEDSWCLSEIAGWKMMDVHWDIFLKKQWIGNWGWESLLSGNRAPDFEGFELYHQVFWQPESKWNAQASRHEALSQTLPSSSDSARWSSQCWCKWWSYLAFTQLSFKMVLEPVYRERHQHKNSSSKDWEIGHEWENNLPIIPYQPNNKSRVWSLNISEVSPLPAS